uniref:Ribosomal protein S1 n=1 Tax=Dicranema revolutum TaxID=239144 RepID=A0A4D6WRV3_9FLOR|nr:ribosomal protein S1 [Dicranema revolutum]
MSTNKSFTENNFASVLNKYKYNLHVGDIVAGTIFNIEKKGLIVDIGTKFAGYLPIEEISLDSKVNKYDINNITREFFILAYNKNSQQLILSIKRLEYIRAWKRIKQIEPEDIIVYLKVKRINKGGIIPIIEGIQGFIPNSHFISMEDKLFIKNTKIKCKLLLADEKNNKLILSHKKAILAIASNQLKIGDIVIGKVMKIESYGVFIKIHDIPSLLHISEIDDKKINNSNIKKKFQVGNTIKVKILHIDTQQGRLSVSRRNIC